MLTTLNAHQGEILSASEQSVRWGQSLWAFRTVSVCRESLVPRILAQDDENKRDQSLIIDRLKDV
ncbi:hypothetical protein DVH05_016294 [Phytophthora capsici]|nr:hypothetical protein DVH05_016294 [Phytophthora capsici]